MSFGLPRCSHLENTNPHRGVRRIIDNIDNLEVTYLFTYWFREDEIKSIRLLA